MEEDPTFETPTEADQFTAAYEKALACYGADQHSACFEECLNILSQNRPPYHRLKALMLLGASSETASLTAECYFEAHRSPSELRRITANDDLTAVRAMDELQESLVLLYQVVLARAAKETKTTSERGHYHNLMDCGNDSGHADRAFGALRGICRWMVPLGCGRTGW